MTPAQLSEARRKLGLSLSEMALMLGYEGEQARSQMHNLESGKRILMPAQRRLVQAYLAGYRCADWPKR